MDKPARYQSRKHRLSEGAHRRQGDITQQPEDAELGKALQIDNASPGDISLADCLVDSYGAGLYRFARVLLERDNLRASEAALSLTASALAMAMDTHCACQNADCPRTWLYRLVWLRFQREKRRAQRARSSGAGDEPSLAAPARFDPVAEQPLWQDIDALEDARRAQAILKYAFDLDEESIAMTTGLPVEVVRRDLRDCQERFYRDLSASGVCGDPSPATATGAASDAPRYADQPVDPLILEAELCREFKCRWIDPAIAPGLLASMKPLTLAKYQKIYRKHQRVQRLSLLFFLCAVFVIVFASGFHLHGASDETASILFMPTHEVYVFPIYYSAEKNPQQRLSLKLPAEAATHPERKYPVLFIIRSWSETNFFYISPEHYYNHLQDFAHQLGYAVVTLTYRSEWINGGPWVALNDAACALKWVDLYGSYYGLDVNRVILFGHDYGATLASNLGLVNQLDTFTYDCAIEPPGWLRILGVIAYGGGMGVDPEVDSLTLPGIDFNDHPEPTYNTYTRRCVFGANLVDVGLNMIGLVNIHPAHWSTAHLLSDEQQCLAELLPAYWVDSHDPPFLLMYGTGDHVARADKGARFSNYLNETGVSARYVVIEGAGHYSFSAQESTWQAPIREFLAAVDP